MNKGQHPARKRARTPVQERGVETRERIVVAARTLFETKGYHGTNSKEIAASAGVAVGTFYGYFDEKKSLFLEVIARYYREITNTSFTLETGDLTEGTDLRALVGLMVRQLVDLHTIAPDLHREITAMKYGDREIRALIMAQEEVVIGRLALLLGMTRDRLRVSDLEAAARVVHRSAEEVIHGMKMFGSPVGEDRLVRELEDMVSRYLFESEQENDGAPRVRSGRGERVARERPTKSRRR